MENKIVVEIFGDKYSLKSDDHEDYVRDLAHFVDTNMREISKTTKVFSKEKISILTALQIADAYYKMQKKYTELVAFVKEK